MYVALLGSSILVLLHEGIDLVTEEILKVSSYL